MKREYILFIILCLIIILAIVYFYLDKKTTDHKEGFDVKESQELKTASLFTKPTELVISNIPPRPISGSGQNVSIGYYRVNETQEMLLPSDYNTVSVSPTPSYIYDLPKGYYIGMIGENPVVAKLPQDYNRVTIPPFKMISNQGNYITLPPSENYVVTPEEPIDLDTDTNGNKVIVRPGYYRFNENKQIKLQTKPLWLSPAPIEKYRVNIPTGPNGYIIAYWKGNLYVAKASNGMKIPDGYYITFFSNQEVLAKLPDYSVVLGLLPKVNSGYEMPEGYYIANKDGLDVLAKLPDRDDILTLPPKTENPKKLPKGYYIARYSTIEREGTDATEPKEKMAKLPNGYTLLYGAGPDEYNRYIIETDTKEYTIASDIINENIKITLIYDAYRPKPNTQSTLQSELYRLSIDKDDYFGKIIEDKLYEKDYAKTNYDPNSFPEYHKSTKDILDQISTSAQSGSSPSFGSMTVVGPDGKMVEVPYVNGQALPTYYQPGSYTYGTTYVPNYEDSVYLSRSTGLSTLGKMYPTATVMGGFCNTKMSMEELEKKCNAIPADQCASMSCCVLLGGSKCVYGNELGPKLKANYTDTFIKNRDVYYYQGKCYGNCV